jgi:hypothetical protein
MLFEADPSTPGLLLQDVLVSLFAVVEPLADLLG